MNSIALSTQLSDCFAPDFFNTGDNLSDRENLYNDVFRAFMENAPLLAWITDPEGRMVYMNHTYQKALGFDCTDLGKTIFDIFPSHIAQSYWANNQKVFQDKVPVEFVENSDGNKQVYKVVKFPIVVNQVLMVAGWAVDITEQMRLHEQVISQEKANMQAIVASVIEAKELQRRELSGQLRDKITQELVAGKLLLENTIDENTPIVSKAYKTINEAIIQIKELSAALNPDTPEELGLSNALQELSEQYDMTVYLNFSDEDSTTWGKDLRLGLYRIMQYSSILNKAIPGTGNQQTHINLNKDSIECIIDNWIDGQHLAVMQTNEFRHIYNRTTYLKGSITFKEHCLVISLPVSAVEEDINNKGMDSEEE